MEAQSDLDYVDDSWIFESLGSSKKDANFCRLEPDGKENQKKHNSGSEDSVKGRMKDNFSNERARLIKNVYSLIVTARSQINALKAEKRLLENKLEANCITRCPKCSRIFDVRKNWVKPKYLRVLKARNTLELNFGSLELLKDWLQLNQLEVNEDGLPVLMETRRSSPTLTSTESRLIHQKVL